MPAQGDERDYLAVVEGAWASALLRCAGAESLPVDDRERRLHRVGSIAARGVSEIVAGDYLVAARSKACRLPGVTQLDRDFGLAAPVVLDEGGEGPDFDGFGEAG
jgi:hypothetical protein